ncbi:hypothetical protein TNIN_701 [Trichonephila inaurata madagascariensis]|uniref:Uncharacterized protein n=1 Tax=Trichonephila inaurata madagascariensis TaxID=2747483 RepID=A0A8X6IL22_9ARAC|nr:hypothetical protein TNIN_701 [Trichonephila inaurata madagascariensis]
MMLERPCEGEKTPFPKQLPPPRTISPSSAHHQIQLLRTSWPKQTRSTTRPPPSTTSHGPSGGREWCKAKGAGTVQSPDNLVVISSHVATYIVISKNTIDSSEVPFINSLHICRKYFLNEG